MFKHPTKPSFWLVLLMGLALQACHIIHFKSSIHQMEHTSIASLKFEYLTINSSIKYLHEARLYKLSIQFRIHYGHLIWFSVKLPWGIEVARGRITPANIEIIDHSNHTYNLHNYTTIQAKWHLPCSYELIEAMLLGKLPAGYSKQNNNQINNDHFVHQKGTWQLEAMINKKIGQITQLTVTDLLTRDQVKIRYKAWKHYAPGLSFSDAQLSLDHIMLDIVHKKIQVPTQKLSFPFTIPRSYVNS